MGTRGDGSWHSTANCGIGWRCCPCIALAAAVLAAEPPAKQPEGPDAAKAPRAGDDLEGDDLHHRAAPRGRLPGLHRRLNRRAGEGVTRDNNAAVPFWRAVGPGGVPKDRREKYFRLLDILPPADKGDYFVDVWQYLDEHAGAETSAGGDATKSPPPAEVWKKHMPATIRPWSKAEFPLLAQWVEANEKPLDLVVEACKRPRCFDPLVAAGSNLGARIVFRRYDTHGDPGLFPFAEASIPIAKALVARAMLRLQEGKKGKAWEDLMACHRLARLAGQGPTGFAALVAWAIDQRAQTGTGCCWSTPGRARPRSPRCGCCWPACRRCRSSAEAVDTGRPADLPRLRHDGRPPGIR